MNGNMRLAILFAAAVLCSARPVEAQSLRLEVLPTTLEAWISNPTAAAISMDAYHISSNAGILDPLGWASIDDSAAANPAAVAAALGGGALTFAEPAGLTPFFLTELNPTGVGVWQAGTRWSIGFPFSSLPDPHQTAFQYSTPAASVNIGEVLIIPEPTGFALLSLASGALLLRLRNISRPAQWRSE